MGASDSDLDNIFESKKRVKNPLVPIGNSQLGQKLMRARVVVQGATVALMVGTAYYYGEKF
uniref:HIG1 domain-containing protein n=1 Tax=Kalanchoe fedtschenkoi TaxID=63787 RepID=A0A7N0TPC5_KALFE